MLPRTIDWVDGRIGLIDQTALPTIRTIAIDDVDTLVDAIRRLVVRGAPGTRCGRGRSGWRWPLAPSPAPISPPPPSASPPHGRRRSTSPSGVHRALAAADDGPTAVLAAALAVRDEDVAACHAIGERGAALLADLCGPGPLRLVDALQRGRARLRRDGARRWASSGRCTRVGRGSAGRRRRDPPAPAGCADHRRRARGPGHPRTAWWSTGRGRSVITRAATVDAVVVGADRVAANGDVANKIGTYPLALAAGPRGHPVRGGLPRSPRSTLRPRTGLRSRSRTGPRTRCSRAGPLGTRRST